MVVAVEVLAYSQQKEIVNPVALPSMIMVDVYKHWICLVILYDALFAELIEIVQLYENMSDIDDALDFVFGGVGHKKCGVRPLIKKCGKTAKLNCAICLVSVCDIHIVGDICIHCAA